MSKEQNAIKPQQGRDIAKAPNAKARESPARQAARKSGHAAQQSAPALTMQQAQALLGGQVPLAQLPPALLTEIAALLGNDAMNALLAQGRPQRAETMYFDPPQSTPAVDAVAIETSPPAQMPFADWSGPRETLAPFRLADLSAQGGFEGGDGAGLLFGMHGGAEAT